AAKYGLRAAATVVGLFAISMMLVKTGVMDMNVSMVVGYAAMVLALLSVYFGIRTHRETLGDGYITFAKALQVGLLITLITCAAYVISWELAYFGGLFPDFLEKYQANVVEGMKAAGKSEAAIAEKVTEMEWMAKNYDNVFFNSGLTLLEILPVGLIVTIEA